MRNLLAHTIFDMMYKGSYPGTRQRYSPPPRLKEKTLGAPVTRPERSFIISFPRARSEAVGNVFNPSRRDAGRPRGRGATRAACREGAPEGPGQQSGAPLPEPPRPAHD